MDVKKEATEDFKNERIKLSTLLNVLSDDITKLLEGGYTISETILKIEVMNDVKIIHGTATTWIRRNKKKLLKKGERNNEEKSIEEPSHQNSKNGSSDSSQKESGEEVEVSKNDTSNDNKDPLEVFNSDVDEY